MRAVLMAGRRIGSLSTLVEQTERERDGWHGLFVEACETGDEWAKAIFAHHYNASCNLLTMLLMPLRRD